MPTNLAPVYLDDARVQLQGDPRPKVSKIVAAGGKEVASELRVVRLGSPTDEGGRPVELEQVIDRAQETGPIYLRCLPSGETQASFTNDESTGVPQFGAARRGMAGQGAQGGPAAELPADKQAKSDFTGPANDLDHRNGASNQTYGAGDLAPGGRMGLTQDRGGDSTHVDGQEFLSGGRNGEGGAPPYRDADVGSTGPVGHDEGIGARGRRQAGPRPISSDPAQGAQGGIRDQSTDHSGRQQGQGAWRGDPADDRTTKYEDGHSSARRAAKRPSAHGDDGATSADAD